ncbi:MAG: hypothetical protein U1E47_02090 [Rivihabitans pingtungensis]
MRATLDPENHRQFALDTPRVADMLKQPNASQLVRGMRLYMENPRPAAATPCWQPAQLRQLSPECRHRGRWLSVCWCIGVLSAMRHAPAGSAQDRINGCFRRSMNGAAASGLPLT